MASESVTPDVAVGQSNTAAPAPAAPSPVSIKDDLEVILPGNEKPVKWGEWFGNYQRKHTEATTARSSLQAQLKEAQGQIENTRREAERYRQALNLPQHREDPRKGIRDKVGQLAYLKGEDAANLYQSIAEEIDSSRQALSVRDEAIRLMAGEMSQLKQVLGQVLHRHNLGDFNTKIAKYREELGLPEEAQEYLSELYSAYEGDDLDSEFPNIAKKRIEQLQAMFRAVDKKRVEEARRAKFVPGKGGQGVPGKSGLPDTSKMSSKETADVLFEAMQAMGDPT